MGPKKLVLIYSAGFDNVGIDDLSEDRKGIYVYSGSYADLERLADGDVVVFFQTNKRQAYMFPFRSRSRISESNSLYIEFPRDHLRFDLSIDEFKNLSFIDIDPIRPWVRSPLSSGRNILLLDDRHLLEGFLDLGTLDRAFREKQRYLRTYRIGGPLPDPDDLAGTVFLSYDRVTRVFGREYSIFAPNGRDTAITGLGIDAIIERNAGIGSYLTESYRAIASVESTEIETYVRYYDLTRWSRIIKELASELVRSGKEPERAKVAIVAERDAAPLPASAILTGTRIETAAPPERVPAPLPWMALSGATSDGPPPDAIPDIPMPAETTIFVPTAAAMPAAPSPVPVTTEPEWGVNTAEPIDGQSIESLGEAEAAIERASIEKERLAQKHRETMAEIRKATEEEVSKLKHQIDALRLNYTLEYFLNKSAVDELGYDSREYYDELEKGTFVASAATWHGWFGGRLKKLNYVLPALRVSYLGQWKETIANSQLSGPEKSEEMRKIIEKFDDILTQDQKRDQKSVVFKWLMGFLFFETVLVFGMVYMMRVDYTSMSLLVGATLAQITVIIYHIVKNLYPVDTAQVQSLQFQTGAAKIETVKPT